jgi:hypothetical protein
MSEKREIEVLPRVINGTAITNEGMPVYDIWVRVTDEATGAVLAFKPEFQNATPSSCTAQMGRVEAEIEQFEREIRARQQLTVMFERAKEQLAKLHSKDAAAAAVAARVGKPSAEK